MTDYKPAHLAKEADRLSNDEILNKALDDIKLASYEALSQADVGDQIKLLRLQQRIAVVEEIRSTLNQWITQGRIEEDTGPYV